MYKGILEILEETDEVIVNRGQAYYRAGMVTSITRNAECTIVAEVEGSSDYPYTVEIITDSSGRIESCTCDCPYEYGDICKHIVAVLLMLANEDEDAHEPQQAAPARPSAQEVLDKLDEQQMRKFLRSRIAADSSLAKALCDYFTPPDMAQELPAIRQDLRRLCRQADAFFDYGLTASGLYERMDVHAAQARLRLEQGHHLLAAQIASEVLSACLENVERDEGEGDLCEIVTDMTNLICAAADGMKSEEIASIAALLEQNIERCAKYGMDSEVECLLKEAVQLRKAEQQDYLHVMLDKIAQEWCAMPVEAMQHLTARMIEHFDGEMAASAYRMAHLENDSFCEMAIVQAMAEQDDVQAEKLCKEKLETCGEKHLRQHWLKLLQQVYQETENEEGQLDVLRELVQCSPETYYEELRQVYVRRGTWEQNWPALREWLKAALHPGAYMSILHREKQWPQLLQMVECMPEKILIYGRELMVYDRSRTVCLFESMILQLARAATQRSAYAYVCRCVHALHRAGGHTEALQMIERLQAEFKRKSAFQDELKKLREKMK